MLNEIYDKLAEEWQMTSEEVQNAIYKEWYKKYHESDKPQAASTKPQASSLTSKSKPDIG